MDFKKLRKKKQLTQEEVARRVPMSLYAYQLIERGTTFKPRPATLEKLKEILNNERQTD